ncbi:carboxypeptidase-like regulatory domain-containing protein [Chitinophaga sp. S165]|uniref:carboxypeptidase-like regulatory domain-containing protein n=1 Tax=Chitinophaga sp. S165 TaxID=2135462 RepID=UPI000D709A30|nr:carboxypeptidase-like regulatory domain-containing protein [Chitinophaga sp. S165]PWV46495.1 carboxypeptidase-like protein [Chitinophaga sp. S165]
MGNCKSLKINIPEPCTEAWNEMLPENDGRFCLSCQKKVIDFSAMSDYEILQTLSTVGKGGCGRFDDRQLDRLIIQPPKPSRPFFPMALLVTLLSAIIPEVGKAQHVTNITASVTNAFEMHLPASIEGRIIDAASGDGLPHVTILLKGTATGCTSDETGHFKLNIPESVSDRSPVFRISCIGYDEIAFRLDSSNILPYTISLKRSLNILREVDVVSSVPYRKGGYTTGVVRCISRTTVHHANWWHRLTQIFRKKEKYNVE